MTTDVPIRTTAEGIAAATAEIVEMNAVIVDILESLGAGDPPPETIFLHRVADALTAFAAIPPASEARRRRRDVGAA